MTPLSIGTEIWELQWLLEGWGSAWGILLDVFRMLSHIREVPWQTPEFCDAIPTLTKSRRFFGPSRTGNLCWKRSVNRKSPTKNPVAEMNGRASGAVPWNCQSQLIVLLLTNQSWVCSSSGTAALLLCSFPCRQILPSGRSKVCSMKRFNTFLLSPGTQ